MCRCLRLGLPAPLVTLFGPAGFANVSFTAARSSAVSPLAYFLGFPYSLANRFSVALTRGPSLGRGICPGGGTRRSLLGCPADVEIGIFRNRPAEP